MKRLRLTEYAKTGAALVATVLVIVWMLSVRVAWWIVLPIGIVLFVVLMYALNPETQEEREKKLKAAKIGEIILRIKQATAEVRDMTSRGRKVRVSDTVEAICQLVDGIADELMKRDDVLLTEYTGLEYVAAKVREIVARYVELTAPGAIVTESNTDLVINIEEKFLPQLKADLEALARKVASGRQINLEVDMEMLELWFRQHQN